MTLRPFQVRVLCIIKNSKNPASGFLEFWRGTRDSNPQPTDSKSATLSVELVPQIVFIYYKVFVFRSQGFYAEAEAFLIIYSTVFMPDAARKRGNMRQVLEKNMVMAYYIIDIFYSVKVYRKISKV